MDDQFFLVETWQGYVMVSAYLLPLFADERTRTYTDSQASKCTLQDVTTLNGATPPAVPSYWDYERYVQGEPDSDVSDVRKFLTDSPPDRPSLRAGSEDLDELPSMPVTNSDSVSTPEEHYWLSSPQPPNSYSSNGHSPVAWEGPTTLVSTNNFAQHNYPLAEEELAQIIGAEQPFQPGSFGAYLQPSKRRKLSPTTTPVDSIHPNLYATDASSINNISNIQYHPKYYADTLSATWQRGDSSAPRTAACLSTRHADSNSSNNKHGDTHEQNRKRHVVDKLEKMEYKEREYARQQLKAINDWLSKGLP